MAINTSNIKLQITRGNNMAKRKTPTREIKNTDTKGLPRETFEYLYPEQETIRVPTRPTLPKKGKKSKQPKGRDPRTPTNRKLIMQKKIKKEKMEVWHINYMVVALKTFLMVINLYNLFMIREESNG